jgi:hypothetical protein
VGEPGQTVNLVSLTEWVRIQSPPQFGVSVSVSVSVSVCERERECVCEGEMSGRIFLAFRYHELKRVCRIHKISGSMFN